MSFQSSFAQNLTPVRYSLYNIGHIGKFNLFAMAQLDFLMVGNEINSFLAHLIDLKCKFIPDSFYESKEFQILKDVNSIISNSLSNRLFLVINEVYSKHPLEMREVNRIEGSRYYVVQRSGGPTIDLFLPKIIQDEGSQFLSSGFIAIFPYIYTLDNQKIKASPELKGFYSRIESYIKKGAYKLKTKHRTYYTSKNALDEIKAGILPVGIPLEYLKEIIKI